ncbi:CSMD1 [Branchiostoma lanceolatum]|uniref:CSMD1 protein n=1 Tax=Branchiostoma lanceolatum TaxID=7740 RepID=A0A8J9Z842_BRALA|nr:CSMD1 [Branchiostoma lanceolatum]
MWLDSQCWKGRIAVCLLVFLSIRCSIALSGGCNDGYYSPRCDRVQCPTIPAPENGAVTGGTFYQNEVQFTCNHGYQLIGDSIRTCQADGTWTGADPTCIGNYNDISYSSE